jgi:hypothetical protein
MWALSESIIDWWTVIHPICESEWTSLLERTTIIPFELLQHLENSPLCTFSLLLHHAGQQQILKVLGHLVFQ